MILEANDPKRIHCTMISEALPHQAMGQQLWPRQCGFTRPSHMGKHENPSHL
jgi:hypothetical protein